MFGLFKRKEPLRVPPRFPRIIFTVESEGPVAFIELPELSLLTQEEATETADNLAASIVHFGSASEGVMSALQTVLGSAGRLTGHESYVKYVFKRMNQIMASKKANTDDEDGPVVTPSQAFREGVY